MTKKHKNEEEEVEEEFLCVCVPEKIIIKWVF